MRTVVFDLDGTLADTSADLIASANECFRALGHGDRLDANDAATAFRGGRAMLRLGFERVGIDWTEADVDTQFPLLLEYYGQAIAVHTKLYPGAAEAVEALRASGYATAICTNKPEGLAETLLGKLGIRQMFGSMIGADTLSTRKPDAAPYVEAVRRAGGTVSRSMLLGDTETDRLTGHAAGIPVALVTFGPEGDAVRALEPEALLHGFADLPEVVRRLVG
ncbi:HAD hydrolase-like protein [Falsirhodobacter deserti]|uniref:HAD hydrolase-like protein n=1 Tax=Falsirhodobacter deserti TaxID=1365611 RepID=UPI000FE2A363|nr:HAD hydrolase-like protein [Falsirhodobacter deserti]